MQSRLAINFAVLLINSDSVRRMRTSEKMCCRGRRKFKKENEKKRIQFDVKQIALSFKRPCSEAPDCACARLFTDVTLVALL